MSGLDRTAVFMSIYGLPNMWGVQHGTDHRGRRRGSAWPDLRKSGRGERQGQVTLSAGLASLRGRFLTGLPILSADSVVASLPMIVLFVFMRRQHIAGIAFTSSKG